MRWLDYSQTKFRDFLTILQLEMTHEKANPKKCIIDLQYG